MISACSSGAKVKISDKEKKTGIVELFQPEFGIAPGQACVFYSKDDIAKLHFIGRARRFGFSIYECRELLSLYQDKNRPSREVKELTLEKLARIDNKLDELRNLRNQLYHLSKSCSGDDRPDCPILDALASEN